MAMTLSQVKAAMLAKADGSGLKPADIAKLKMSAFTAALLLDHCPGLPQQNRAAFKIPYFDLSGKETSFYRVRYVEQATGFQALSGKSIKYAQPKESTNDIYLPPLVSWSEIAKDTNEPLYITEGELKSACATKLKIPTIGLGGVNMFSDRKQGDFVLPTFKKFLWDGRKAYVVFDSDAVTNPNVLRAESTLCRELHCLGAETFIIRLPTGDAKVGLDDYLVEHGIDAFYELVDAAKPFAISKELHALNEELIFVAGSDIVFSYSRDLRMRPSAFVKSQYANRRVLVATAKSVVERSAAQEWLNWPARAEVEKFTYQPGVEQYTQQRELNLWQPWPYDPIRGDVSLWERVMAQIFQPDEQDSRKWWEQWVAFPMQHPGAKLKTACIWWGGQGTGKSFVAETIMRLYGAHNTTKFGNLQLNSQFNEWAEHKQFGVGEEIIIHANEKKSVAEMLKTMVTDTNITINRKFVNSYTLPNCMNFMALTNHPAGMKLEEDDRRFFVHHIRAPKMSPELYKPFDTWSKSEAGLSALFYYFLNLDTKSFDPEAPAYKNLAKEIMTAGGRSEHGQWVSELINDPDTTLMLNRAPIRRSLFSTEELFVLYKVKHERSMLTKVGMANELSMQGLRYVYPHPLRTADGPKRLWVIRPQNEFRSMTPTQLAEFYDRERGIKK